jgi:hypothetical protein
MDPADRRTLEGGVSGPGLCPGSAIGSLVPPRALDAGLSETCPPTSWLDPDGLQHPECSPPRGSTAAAHARGSLQHPRLHSRRFDQDGRTTGEVRFGRACDRSRGWSPSADSADVEGGQHRTQGLRGLQRCRGSTHGPSLRRRTRSCRFRPRTFGRLLRARRGAALSLPLSSIWIDASGIPGPVIRQSKSRRTI